MSPSKLSGQLRGQRSDAAGASGRPHPFIHHRSPCLRHSVPVSHTTLLLGGLGGAGELSSVLIQELLLLLPLLLFFPPPLKMYL